MTELYDQDKEKDDRDRRPHSKACGIWPHQHGRQCSPNCPTCHGRDIV